MKFSEIEKEQDQISIGQQLEIMSKMKEIEYQNSLVMMSLEQYNSKYEQLKKEQTELLEKANQKIDNLKQSNEILNQSIESQIKNLNQKSEKEILNLTDRVNVLMKSIEEKINTLLDSKLENINKQSTEYIENLKALEVQSTKRYQSYFGRKKILDILAYINLAVTPLLFLIIAYILFIKK